MDSLGIRESHGQHHPTVELFRRNGLQSRQSLDGVTRAELQALGFDFGTANAVARAASAQGGGDANDANDTGSAHTVKPPSVKKKQSGKKVKRKKRRARSHSLSASLQQDTRSSALRHEHRRRHSFSVVPPPTTVVGEPSPPSAQKHSSSSSTSTSRTLSTSSTRLFQTWKPRVYLSHTWATDTEGRDTHARMEKLHKALVCSSQVDSWFDNEQMQGDVTDTMCEGIDGCDIVIVCITRAFIDKCRQKTNSNCKLELHYAYERKGAAKLLPIVLESNCLDTRTWNGPLGMYLNKRFYIACTTDAEMLQNVGAIVKEVYNLIGRPLLDASRQQRTIVDHWRNTIAARKSTPPSTKKPAPQA